MPRHVSVVVKARDPKGKEIRVKAEGWFARILQHEIDHLDGVLYIDRIKPEDVREATEADTEEEGGPPEPDTPPAYQEEARVRQTACAGKRGRWPMSAAAGKYHIWTVGCQMNQADSQRVSSILDGLGWEESADDGRRQPGRAQHMQRARAAGEARPRPALAAAATPSAAARTCWWR